MYVGLRARLFLALSDQISRLSKMTLNADFVAEVI